MVNIYEGEILSNYIFVAFHNTKNNSQVYIFKVNFHWYCYFSRPFVLKEKRSHLTQFCKLAVSPVITRELIWSCYGYVMDMIVINPKYDLYLLMDILKHYLQTCLE